MFRRILRKIWIPLSIVAVLIISYFSIATYFMYSYSHEEIPENADYLIVLGAQVKGTTPSKALQLRIETAAEYLLENPDTVAIASGGQGPDEGIPEAQAIKEGLVELGVEEDRILLEDRSTSTIENIEYSMELMPEDPGTVLICTNNYHVFRAVETAEEVGLEATGLSAPVPESVKWELYLREYAAIAYHTLLRDIQLIF